MSISKPQDVFCGKTGMLFTAFGEDSCRMVTCVKNPYKNDDTKEAIYIEYDACNYPPNVLWGCTKDMAKILFLEACDNYMIVLPKDDDFLEELSAIECFYEGMEHPVIYGVDCETHRIKLLLRDYKTNAKVRELLSDLQTIGHATLSHTSEPDELVIFIDISGVEQDVVDSNMLPCCELPPSARYVIERRDSLLGVIRCVKEVFLA